MAKIPKVDLRPWKSRYAHYLRPKPKKVRKPLKPRPRPPKRRRDSPEYSGERNLVSQLIVTDSFGNTTVTNGTTNDRSAGISLYKRTWSGTTTPGYLVNGMRKKRKKPLHPFSSVKRVISGTPSYSEYQYSSTGLHVVQTTEDAGQLDTFWPSDYGDTVTSQATFLARKRLADRVNKASVNLGVMFAERKQTANLILSTAKRIFLAARALKHGKLDDLYAVLGVSTRVPGIPEYKRLLNTPPEKRLANHWLEYNFGWLPLLNDVYGSCELLAAHAVGTIFHEEATASAKGTNRQVRSLAVHGRLGYLREDVRVRYVCRYRLDSYARAALDSTGISNPLTVLWEILPYSFVVDWFIPVSTYLQTLNAFDGFELLEGTKSVLWKGEELKDYTRGNYLDGVGARSGWAKFNEIRYTRTVETAFPSAVLPSFRNPLEKGPLWKTLTSLALLRQLFGK